MERTLVVFKPDAVQRGIIGEILTRFERAGLQIVGMKMVAPDESHFHKHYEEISKLISRWGEDIYRITMSHMSEGPVIALVLEGVEVVAHVRKMVGATDPKDALPGTIRGDFTHVTRDYTNNRNGTLPNILHASGNVDEAIQEIALWFADDEIYNYQTPGSSIVHGKIVEQ